MWAYMLCWAGDSGGTMYRHDTQVTVRKIYFGNLLIKFEINVISPL